MLTQIFITILIIAAAVMVGVDLVITESDDLLGHPDGSGSGYEVWPRTIGDTRGDRTGASFPEPFGTVTPAAGHDVGQGRRPVSHGHGQRHVRSRLQLIAVIPAAAVTVIALCVVGLTYFLSGAQVYAPDSSVRVGSILWAVAIVIVMIIILMLAVWATVGTATSVLRPLYRLRSVALVLADGRPSDAAAADVASPDEIGDIARALEQMRGRMSRSAGDEAGLRNKLDAMLANLSRRSQSPIERQIRLIETLEQAERDRERRAILFRISRIAARMHRDSQNLLVLAGHELASGWNQPMLLLKVIRAALSEIEEYERVSVHAQPDIAVSGPAVNDTVHLLAELIQNATSFSAADMPVEVSGQLMDTGGVLIRITDRGVGMSAEDMAHANWRLENPPSVGIDVPRWIGLLVVSRLAVRRGVRVRLQHAEFGGLAALVWIPDELLARPEAALRPEPTASREEVSAPPARS